MKKSMYVTGLLLVAVLVTFVSCKADVSLNGGLTDLNLNLITDTRTKSLGTNDVYTTGMTVSSYQYKATCISNPGAKGTQSSWTTLAASGNTAPGNLIGEHSASATLERLARGSWKIEVRALNSTGGVILQGEDTCLLKTTNQTLSITLNTTVSDYADEVPANVTVSIGVTVPTIPGGSVSVRYVPLRDVSTLAADGSAGTTVSLDSQADCETDFEGSGIKFITGNEGNTAYRGSVDLYPGLYVLQVLYKEADTVIAGQIIAFRVNEKAPFAINGALESGEFLDLILTPIYETSRTITLNWAPGGTPAILTDNRNIVAQVDASAEEGTLGVCTYIWFINGVPETNAETTENIEQGKFISTSSYNPGSYSVSCIVSATINGSPSVGYLNYDLTIE